MAAPEVGTVSGDDRRVLRKLGRELAEIAALPVHGQTAAEWARLNSLQHGRPLVWINEIPWHEMDVDGELKLQAEDPFLQSVETGIRRTLYLWRHMPVDMVVDDRLYAPLAIGDTGFGIGVEEDIARTDERSGVVSHRYHCQFRDIEDVARIRMPEITHDTRASDRAMEATEQVFNGVLPVEPRGVAGYWFAPWDALVMLWEPQQALIDLVLRPELVHAAMERLVSAYVHRLDRYEELGLLSPNNGNCRIGSGGLGYCDELPASDFDPCKVRPIDQWGSCAAQIFGEVSPAMHEEFALRYERRWLERFGLTYYGCCEPLDRKIDVLRSIPNLRKVSMSPWVDVERGAAALGTDYVFSYKPSPAYLGEDRWRPEAARRSLREALEKARGCVVEIIMKDISTVRYEPQRLWEWARIAMEEAARAAS
jgi:hypothetical protein